MSQNKKYFKICDENLWDVTKSMFWNLKHYGTIFYIYIYISSCNIKGQPMNFNASALLNCLKYWGSTLYIVGAQ